MATRRQVSCINKTDRYNAHERISAIGGIDSYGSRWKTSQEQAIINIESGTYEYYTTNRGYEAKVIVASRERRKYLKTQNDGEQPDNLLSLQECP